MSVGDVLTYFVHQLKASLEAAPSLRRGEAFLPVHLKGWRLSRYLFAPVAEHLASSLGWRLARERRISFPAKYQVWNSMCVDYVFTDELACRPTVYLELETLDRAQLYNFLPRRDDDVDDSKLWHYYGILAKHLENIERAPRAQVFLLVLTDAPVVRHALVRPTT